MIHNTLKWIIGLMSLALIGLIVLQYQWLRKDIELTQQQFDRNVKHALDRVLANYLEEEMLSSSAYQTYITQGQFVTEINQQGNNIIIEQSLETIEEKDVIVSIDTQVTFTSCVSVPSNNSPPFVHKTSTSSSMDYQFDSIRRIHIRRLENNCQEVSLMIDSFRDHISYRMKEMLSSLDHQNTTIDYARIDNLLAQEFSCLGINTTYEYGIHNENENRLLYASNEDIDINNLYKSDYKTLLIGRSNLQQPASLLVHFPNKQGFVLKQMSFTLLSSIFFILVICGCFGIAISTILRQKKVAEVKNDFINNMTHEFKTPITNVSLAIEALLNFGVINKPKKAERYLNIVKSENERLASQVDKVLQIARLEKKDFKLKIKPININELIQKVVQNFKMQVENRGGALDTLLNAQQTVIEGDEVHLTNVLANLVDNANKYSPENPHIKIQTEDTPKGLKIAVSDNGIGIAKEHLNEVFKKFYRVPTGNVHDVKGFGLGLNYVWNIVERHLGIVKVASTPQSGSTFEILLPYKINVE